MKSRKVLEAYQKGRKKNLEALIGKKITSVGEPRKSSMEIFFDDGTKLEVSGSTEHSSEAIFYKIHIPESGEGLEGEEEDEEVDSDTFESSRYTVSMKEIEEKLPEELIQRLERGVSPEIEKAFDDWLSGRAYIDGRGNYRLKKDHEGKKIKSKIAPWNREVKNFFGDVQILHYSAHWFDKNKR